MTLTTNVWGIIGHVMIWRMHDLTVPVPCAQSYLTLCHPMDSSLPRSSVHGIIPGKNTGANCHFLLQGVFPTQGSNPTLLCLLYCRQILYPLSHQESPHDLTIDILNYFFRQINLETWKEIDFFFQFSVFILLELSVYLAVLPTKVHPSELCKASLLTHK